MYWGLAGQYRNVNKGKLQDLYYSPGVLRRI